jgi:LuxR family maltose regulon positive regulatory protein
LSRNSSLLSGISKQVLPVSPSTRPQPLVEPLTNREFDILDLLAQRLQNKEIAEELFISKETVKTHLNNIYQKLNVTNRRNAVEKAKNLGILSP